MTIPFNKLPWSIGKVNFAEAHKQRRNEGFVEFASEMDMKSALEKLNGADLDGRRINLIRQRFRSRLGSKSRSRSPRSRSRHRSPRSTGYLIAKCAGKVILLW